MNALFKVTEELEESSRIKLDATTMSMINFIFQRATSMMRLVPQINFSKLNLSQTIPVYENDTNEIRNVDRFINTYNMINTFPKNTEEQIDKLDKLYGDFENLTYSSISMILLDLMEDLSNSIKADFILPRVIVSDEFVDENDEKSLDDMLKWERIYNSSETNQTGLHGNSKNSSGDIIYHYVIEATYRQSHQVKLSMILHLT
uniref:Uncharacterized protein n=1 Tax=Acrobeloides nanus TaxID=290746 RepID=A0A914BWN4_9BILA